MFCFRYPFVSCVDLCDCFSCVALCFVLGTCLSYLFHASVSCFMHLFVWFVVLSISLIFYVSVSYYFMYLFVSCCFMYLSHVLCICLSHIHCVSCFVLNICFSHVYLCIYLSHVALCIYLILCIYFFSYCSMYFLCICLCHVLCVCVMFYVSVSCFSAHLVKWDEPRIRTF